MWNDFKKFIFTGNVIDFAIGVILATIIGAVVNGFLTDIMMPIIGHLVGGINFNDLKVVLSPAELGADGKEVKPENAIMYGRWISTIVNLFITGFILYLIVKAKNRVNPPVEVPAGPSDNELLAEIRDLLKK